MNSLASIDPQTTALWVSAVAATLALVALIAQLALLRRQGHREQAILMSEVAEAWRRERSQWRIALMWARGPDAFYLDVDPGDRDRLRRALEEDTDEATRPYFVAARESITFLGFVSSLVLRGRLAAGEAYEVLGPDVVRNGRTLRQLMSDVQHTSYWIDSYPGLKRRVLVLIDVLWAEAARLGELSDWDLEKARRVKNEHGTGRRNRERCFKLAHLLGGRRVARRLSRHLKHAEQEPDRRIVQWEEDYTAS